MAQESAPPLHNNAIIVVTECYIRSFETEPMNSSRSIHGKSGFHRVTRVELTIASGPKPRFEQSPFRAPLSSTGRMHVHMKRSPSQPTDHAISCMCVSCEKCAGTSATSREAERPAMFASRFFQPPEQPSQVWSGQEVDTIAVSLNGETLTANGANRDVTSVYTSPVVDATIDTVDCWYLETGSLALRGGMHDPGMEGGSKVFTCTSQPCPPCLLFQGNSIICCGRSLVQRPIYIVPRFAAAHPIFILSQTIDSFLLSSTIS